MGAAGLIILSTGHGPLSGCNITPCCSALAGHANSVQKISSKEKQIPCRRLEPGVAPRARRCEATFLLLSLQAAQGSLLRGFATYPSPGGPHRGSDRHVLNPVYVCPQCGCCCGWIVKRFAHPEVQQYCRVSATQEQHTGHGPDATLPQHARRGAISSDCRDWIKELVLEGFPQAEVIKRVRIKVQEAFAADPYFDGGLEVCTVNFGS